MLLVIIESPCKATSIAQQLRNRKYAIKCMLDSIDKGEAPFAAHLLYPQILTEETVDDQNVGIKLGLQWGEKAAKTIVYQDLGITSEMNYGIRNAFRHGRPIEYRNIPNAIDHNIDSLEALALEVSEYFGVKLMDMKSPLRDSELLEARMVYFAVARKLFRGVSYNIIGSVVHRNHSTVVHAVQMLSLKTYLTTSFDRFCADKQLKFEPCQ